MFWHIYKAKLKCIVRNKQMMFWTMLFPLLLGTFFQLALSDLASHEAFERIPVAVVETPEFERDAAFRQTLAAVSREDESGALLSVIYTDREDAERMLRAGEIVGVIDYAPNLRMTVLQSGIHQTILKSFLDDYVQSSKTAEAVIAQNPLNAPAVIDGLMRRESYIRDEPVSSSVKDPYVTFFYALIAMACLYGGFLGMEEANRISADMSPQGMRASVAPTHKMKVFASSIAAAVTVQLAEIAVLMGYLTQVFGVDFGNQLPLIAAVCAAGTVCGASLGTMIGCIVKGSEGKKTGILVAISMAMSYMAGMMDISVRFTISQKAPVVALLNPANLICDAFYSLYFGPNPARFTRDILLLLALTAAFSLIAYGKLRRRKYASI